MGSKKLWSASSEAVEIARQSIAIPAEEATKQAQERTTQLRWMTLRSAIDLTGVVAAAAISVEALPWVATVIGVVETLSLIQAWRHRSKEVDKRIPSP